MAQIVADASVLIAVASRESEKERLIELTQYANLIAPYSVHWEIGNAFSAMLKRSRISIEDAIQAIGVYQNIPIRFVHIELMDALKIAHSLDIYAYEAYLIRCAIKYKSPLLSLDKKLLNQAKFAKAQVIEVTS